MKFSVFFLAILLFASCATNNDSKTGIERWKAQNIHNYNYKISFESDSFTGDYLVTVRNDSVTKVLRSDRTELNSWEDLLDFIYSFDGYYYWLDTLKADVKYLKQDSVYGYPNEGYVRYEENTLHGIGFKIHNVEFLK